jgi:cytochrome c oxidase subunit II
VADIRQVMKSKMNHLIQKTPLTLCLIFCSLFLISGCASLEPKGEAAIQIANLAWIMFSVGSLIWIVFTVLLFIGLFRRHNSSAYEQLSQQEHTRSVNVWIIGGGIIMPTLVLIGLIVLTVGALRSMPIGNTSDGLVVEVIGHQWWWEVKYPGYDTTLVDEVRIPTGEPVTMRLHSADVIHSFWVPELHGKFDLIPGRVYEFVLQADQPGEYKGRCAEFCGLSHARMTFIVIAMQPEEFTSWLGSQGGN